MTSQFYKDQAKFLLSVDCIIFGFKQNGLYVLIAKRKFAPMEGNLSLMGGFMQPSESIHETTARVLSEYTGIEGVFMEQVGAYGELGRDLGERVVSVAYYALIDMLMFDNSLATKYNAEWVEINEVKSLIFDHNLMITDALKILRRRAATRPIGFNLLPEKFTLPQLQLLYEAIYQTVFDKRNFRKKLLSMDILERLEEKDKSNSRRGAYYYMFNEQKYNALLEKGYFFSL